MNQKKDHTIELPDQNTQVSIHDDCAPDEVIRKKNTFNNSKENAAYYGYGFTKVSKYLIALGK